MSRKKRTTQTLWLTRDAGRFRSYALWKKMPVYLTKERMWDSRGDYIGSHISAKDFYLRGLPTLAPGGGPVKIKVTVEVVK